MIDASLNEVESLAAKAARGAGLSWGLAEETGRAARWLASCDLPWASSLVDLLAEHSTLERPAIEVPGTLGAFGHLPMSPLLAGSYLADAGPRPGPLALYGVAHPMWLLPFAAQVAATGGAAMTLTICWSDCDRHVVTVWPQGGHVGSDPQVLHEVLEDKIIWAPIRPAAGSVIEGLFLPRSFRSSIRYVDWQALEVLGARTYVPSTVASRTMGAGAGLTDTD
jgi:Protein of unknown function (DUF3726)